MTNPIEYPIQSNHPVTPVIIIDENGTRYRTKYDQWLPLRKAFRRINLKQIKTKKKVFIDSHNKWINNLC
jgi:hypothetical protein